MHRPGGRRSGKRDGRPTAALAPAAPPPITRSITLAEGMTVKDLAERLDVRAKDVLKKLIERRMMMTINTTLDNETASMIAREFGAEVEMRTFEEEMLQVETDDAKPEDLTTRAPVVTVMGHVDHGKTTLLDAIRETRVAEREAGGITQHIGAYSVDVDKRRVVFLDTPGHEAFTLMRARGARVTDVVVLVVAADDGVMPQTREAIDHAKAANVPILVAINKIDKPDANPERVKKELSELELVPEDWGGQTVMVEVSAKQRQNLELLLEMVLLVTEMSELQANPSRNAFGTVLEAKLDRGRGPVATILVQDGTLRVGDTFIAGTVVGKVRALIDDKGQQVKSVGPSTPVEVLGLGGVPQPGDTFQGLSDAAKARQIAGLRQTRAKEKELGDKGGRLTLETLQQQISEGAVKELPIIIKADVQGSAEVLADSLAKLSTEGVKVRVIHSGVGAINESDVLLATASNAIIIGFNVRPDRNAMDVAEREQVDVRLHSVIYNVSDEIKKAMVGLLEPTTKETRLGAAQVRQTFKVPKAGTVAGCIVTEGRITRAGDAHGRLLRDNVVVHEGRFASLRRFKEDVNEVKTGLECGIAFERFNDIKVGDVIEVFTVEEVAATV
jgi:translation initiation factor IF-2